MKGSRVDAYPALNAGVTNTYQETLDTSARMARDSELVRRRIAGMKKAKGERLKIKDKGLKVRSGKVKGSQWLSLRHLSELCG